MLQNPLLPWRPVSEIMGFDIGSYSQLGRAGPSCYGNARVVGTRARAEIDAAVVGRQSGRPQGTGPRLGRWRARSDGEKGLETRPDGAVTDFLSTGKEWVSSCEAKGLSRPGKATHGGLWQIAKSV
jgi:hypothetical protein